jgi:DNA-binding MarR family transcriptional regulator
VSKWSVRTRAETQGRRDGEAAGDTASDEFVIEDSLGYLVNRVTRSIAQQLAEEIRPAGVAIGQWAVLMFLWARDAMSQADLSRLVAIEPPTMVRTIDRMVRDGLVTRIADPSDRRVSRIHLTDRGRSLRDELVPKAVTVNATTLGRLSTSEGRTLRRLLVKLLEETGDSISTDRSSNLPAPRIPASTDPFPRLAPKP